MSAIEKKMQKFPLIAVLVTQVFVLFILRNALMLLGLKVQASTFVLAQSFACAFVVKKILRLPHWLATIAFLLPPLFYLCSITFGSSATPIYGAAFIFLALTFSHTLKERVPLYLTNTKTAEALKELIDQEKAKSFLDLGSGTGGVVRAMASEKVKAVGVESAPILWLYSGALSLFCGKGSIWRKNIWKTDLSEFDLVYAFLSPAVMENLWEKVQKEMRPGTLLVSNSFVVPGIKASQILTLLDGRKTKLYLYRIKK